MSAATRKLRAEAVAALPPADTKQDTEREYRPCCGRRVRHCPHGLRFTVQHGGGLNRAQRRHPSPDVVDALAKRLVRPDLTAKDAARFLASRRPRKPVAVAA